MIQYSALQRTLFLIICLSSLFYGQEDFDIGDFLLDDFEETPAQEEPKETSTQSSEELDSEIPSELDSEIPSELDSEIPSTPTKEESLEETSSELGSELSSGDSPSESDDDFPPPTIPGETDSSDNSNNTPPEEKNNNENTDLEGSELESELEGSDLEGAALEGSELGDVGQGNSSVRVSEYRGTRFITLTGSIGANYVFQDNFFDDVIRGGLSENESEDFFDPIVRFRLDAELDSGVTGVLEIHNEERISQPVVSSFGNQYITMRSRDDNFQVEIERAYIQIDEFVSNNLSFKFGVIPHRYALRANGQSFFLDLGEAESAFDSSEDTNAVGFVATYVDSTAGVIDQIYLEPFYFAALEGDLDGEDEGIMGVNIDFILPEVQVEDNDQKSTTLLSYFSFIFAVIYGESDTWVGHSGLSFDYLTTTDPNSYILELYGEFAFQYGHYDRRGTSPAFSVDDQDHFAFGGYGGFRYEVQSPGLPYLDLSYWYLSGDDDDPNRSKNNDFVSYENIDTLMILEDNDYGLDLDSNYMAIKAQTGIELIGFLKSSEAWVKRLEDSTFRKLLEQKLYLELGYGYFRAIDTPAGESKRIGHEIDLRLNWEYTSDLMFTFAGAFLWDSEYYKNILDEIGAEGEDNAFLFRAGANLRF